MNTSATKYLLITLVGHQPSVLNEVLTLISASGCNITHCQMGTLGTELTAYLFISGMWNNIAKLETGLPALEKIDNLRLLLQRVESVFLQEQIVPYLVHISALDQPGVIQKITQFFMYEKMTINRMHMDVYTAPYTAASMLYLNLSVSVPINGLIADLRDRLVSFCDEHNLDVIMEPEKK